MLIRLRPFQLYCNNIANIKRYYLQGEDTFSKVFLGLMQKRQ